LRAPGEVELPGKMRIQGGLGREARLEGDHLLRDLGLARLDLAAQARELPKVVLPVGVADDLLVAHFG
jgi:hypothetical protein